MSDNFIKWNKVYLHFHQNNVLLWQNFIISLVARTNWKAGGIQQIYFYMIKMPILIYVYTLKQKQYKLVYHTILTEYGFIQCLCQSQSSRSIF